ERLIQAREGALELLKKFSKRDSLSLMEFNSTISWMAKDVAMDNAGKKVLSGHIRSLQPRGQTLLYDAIGEAHEYLQKTAKKDEMSAVVVLTDGADYTSKKYTLENLRNNIRLDNVKNTTRVFTIAYGSEAPKSDLKSIADVTRAQFYE